MSVKSRTVAGVLALFLGGLGAHKFYLGKPMWGLLYVLFFWTFVPAVIALFEALFLFLMKDEVFDARFNAGKVPTPDTHVRCPDCRELVVKDARVCKSCGCRLVPQG